MTVLPFVAAVAAIAGLVSTPAQAAELPYFESTPQGEFQPASDAIGAIVSYDANHCEFYVDGFVAQRMHYSVMLHNHVDARIVVSDDLLSGDGTWGQAIRAGMYFQMDAHRTGSAPSAGYYLGESLQDGSFRVRVPYDAGTAPLRQFAFFVDVERPEGDVERLWLTEGAQDFALADVLAGADESRSGRVTIWTAAPESVVFDQRRACAP